VEVTAIASSGERLTLGPRILCTLALMVTFVFLAACGSPTPAGTVSTGSTDTTAEGNTAPESLALTQDDNGGSFEIRAGGTIELSLEANPSTGYSWEMDDPDPEASLIEQIRDPTFVPDDPNAVGSGGTITFTFRAVDRGKMVIKLAYYPPDAAEAPTETFQVDLTVR
jgi:inhibitor of cysteine peptidase